MHNLTENATLGGNMGYLAQLVTICIEIIHIISDMYKTLQKIYISGIICIEIRKNYTCQ